MYDIDTLLGIKRMLQKEIDVAKENIVYSVDNLETLQYARGKLNALESLLQDIMNLQKEEE
jgi:hypothetical protein|tara:strand:+ start:223 stop:405 length:183 start_codon:yes stop_codon:yes gene_type:complete